MNIRLLTGGLIACLAATSFAETPALKFRTTTPALRPPAEPAAPVATVPPPVPISLRRAAGAPLHYAPGLYASYPYTGLVMIPPVIDRRFIIPAPSKLTPNVDIEPPIWLVPVQR